MSAEGFVLRVVEVGEKGVYTVVLVNRAYLVCPVSGEGDVAGLKFGKETQTGVISELG